MSIFVANIILIIISSAYAVLLKRKLAETIFLSIATVILVLYCFGFLNFQGCLLFGIYFIVLIAILSLAYFIYKIAKDKALIFEIGFIQGILIWCILQAFLLYINYNMGWDTGDELSYWGIAVKHMYIFDAFTTYIGGVGSITGPQYFPCTSLFNYFFSRFSSGFREYPAYIAINSLYFSLWIPFIKNIFTKKYFLNATILTAVFVMLPTLHGNVGFSPYASLGVDFHLGFLFGIAIVYYFAYKYEESLYGVLMVSGTLFLLAILKDISILFALIVCGIIFFDVILFKRSYVKGLFQKTSKSSIIKFVLLCSPIIAVAFGYFSWQLHLSMINVTEIRALMVMPSVSDVISIFTGTLATAQRELLIQYLKLMYNGVVSPYWFSMVGFTVRFIILVLFLSLINRKNINVLRSLTAFLIVVGGAALYQTALMLLYLFSFYRWDQWMGLASWNRYTASCMLGMITALFVFFLPVENDAVNTNLQKMKDGILGVKVKFLSDAPVLYKDAFSLFKLIIYKVIPVCLSLVLAAGIVKEALPHFMWQAFMVRSRFSHRYEPRAGSELERWMPYIIEASPTHIYVISNSLEDIGTPESPYMQRTGPWKSRMMQVGVLYPYATTNGYLAVVVGTDVEEAIAPWQATHAKFSPQQLEEFIFAQGFDFVYIDESDESFIADYSRFFPYGIHDYTLYRVQNNDGNVLLIPVNEKS